MNSNVKIIKPSVEDTMGIQEVFYKTWLATYPNKEFGITEDDIKDKYKDAFTDETLEKRREKIKNPPEGKVFFIARDLDRVVGVCGVNINENKLSTIYVLPEYQGQGIGRLLWNEAYKVFDLNKDIIVHVATYNTNAIGFYSKLGFKDTGKRFEDNSHFKSGAIIPEMEMVIDNKK